MGERVSSDNPSVRTFRGRLESSGGTTRPQIVLPADDQAAIPHGVFRFVLGGSTYHADVHVAGDESVIRGVYDNARLARSPGEGENRLPSWLEDAGLSIGRSVLVDEVVPETLYGARAPGTSVVYETIEPPRSSLTRIAEGLDE